jgi:hypothetical protein
MSHLTEAQEAELNQERPGHDDYLITSLSEKEEDEWYEYTRNMDDDYRRSQI